MRYFTKVRLELRVVFWATLFVYLSCELLPLSSISPWFGKAMVEVSSRLSGAYVSAFIFYFLVVHWQRQTDKENLQDHIGPLLQDLIQYAVGMMQPVANRIAGSGGNVDVFLLKRIDIVRAMEFYDTPAEVAYGFVNGAPASVQEMVLYHVDQMRETIKEVFVHYTMIDTELVKMLNELKMTDLMRQPQMFMLANKPSYLAEDQWTFLQRMRPLVDYSFVYPGRKARFPSADENHARMQELMPDNLDELLGMKPDPNIEWKLYWLVKRKKLRSLFQRKAQVRS